MKLSQKIIDWTYFGTQYSTDESVKRHIIFSNVIFLTLPIVYTSFIFIDLDSFAAPGGIFRFDRLIVPITILLCFCFLYLNKIGLTSVSRILFLLSWLLLLHIIPIIVHHTPSDYYIAFPLGIIFHSILIHVSFSSRLEPVKFWLFIAVNFVIMLNSKFILDVNDPTPVSENILRSDPYFELDIILYWLLFNLLMYYVLYVVEHYVTKIRENRNLISIQHQELAEKNEELEQAISSLREVNDHVEELNKNLEDKVSARTRELQLKNEKLVQYAFINAHLLRGPFCRVKGLIMLNNAIAPPRGDDAINRLLMQSLDELDEVTSKIQRAVEINEQVLLETGELK